MDKLLATLKQLKLRNCNKIIMNCKEKKLNKNGTLTEA